MTKKQQTKTIIQRDESGALTYDNTATDFIKITVDKLKWKLPKLQEGKTYRDAFISSLGVFVGILLVFATTTFKEAFQISPYTWQAFFMMLLLASGGGAIYSLYKWYTTRLTTEQCIEELKVK